MKLAKRNDRTWLEDGEVRLLTPKRDTPVIVEGLHGEDREAGDVLYDVREVATNERYPAYGRDLAKPPKKAK